jgi:hypothetical protein
MKRLSIAALLFAACGHAAPPATHQIANTAPPADAQVEAAADVDADADSDESCSAGTEQPMRAGGADGTVSIVECQPAGEEEQEQVRGRAHDDLVFARGDAKVSETVNDWMFPDYDGERAYVSLEGVIGAPGRDQAVVIVRSSSAYDGNGDTSQTSAALEVMVVQDGQWVKVFSLDGSKIDVKVASDGSATVDVDGDARTLRWNGTDITP